MIVLSATGPAAADTTSDVATLRSNITANVLASGVPGDASVAGYLTNLQADGSFANVDYATNTVNDFGALAHVRQLHDMVVAWAQPTGRYSAANAVNHAKLLAEIVSAYNRRVAADYTDPADWWFNQIGVPDPLSEAMVVLQKRGILPTSNLPAALAIVNRASQPARRARPTRRTSSAATARFGAPTT